MILQCTVFFILLQNKIYSNLNGMFITLTTWTLLSMEQFLEVKWPTLKSLRCCHNGHDCISNHQPHDCLLNRLFRRRSKKTSKLRVTGLCEGNPPKIVNSPLKWPVTRKMFPFDDVIMSWHLSTQHDLSLSMFLRWNTYIVSGENFQRRCSSALYIFTICTLIHLSYYAM